MLHEKGTREDYRIVITNHDNSREGFWICEVGRCLVIKPAADAGSGDLGLCCTHLLFTRSEDSQLPVNFIEYLLELDRPRLLDVGSK